MDIGRSRDQSIFYQVILLPVHELRPLPEYRRVSGKNVERFRHLVEPAFNFRRLSGVLLARDLNTGLNFGNRHGAEKKVPVGLRIEPRQHDAVRSRPAELGDDIGIE